MRSPDRTPCRADVQEDFRRKDSYFRISLLKFSCHFRHRNQRDAKEILSQRKLGYSFVRLLPKEAGVRPIVNLKRAPKDGNGRQDSINRILRATFEVLTYEKVCFLYQSSKVHLSVFHRQRGQS